jgi:hypothetical protein
LFSLALRLTQLSTNSVVGFATVLGSVALPMRDPFFFLPRMLLDLAWAYEGSTTVSSRTSAVHSPRLVLVQNTGVWLDCYCFRSSRIVGHNQRRAAG